MHTYCCWSQVACRPLTLVSNPQKDILMACFPSASKPVISLYSQSFQHLLMMYFLVLCTESCNSLRPLTRKGMTKMSHVFTRNMQKKYVKTYGFPTFRNVLFCTIIHRLSYWCVETVMKCNNSDLFLLSWGLVFDIIWSRDSKVPWNEPEIKFYRWLSMNAVWPPNYVFKHCVHNIQKSTTCCFKYSYN